MGKIKKSKTIIIALIIIVLIAGLVVIFTKGLNFDLKYQEAKKIEIYVGKEINVSEIKNITNEIFGEQKVLIQMVEIYDTSVAITSIDITEEQKESLITKINEKYGTEIKSEDKQITKIPHTKGKDIVKPYIAPFIIATVIIFAYMMIRYYKLGSVKVLLKTILILVLAQVMLFSIIAITRIPVGTLTIPMVIIVYFLTLIGIVSRLEGILREKNKSRN